MRGTSHHLGVIAGPRSVLPARPADLAAELALPDDSGGRLAALLRAVGAAFAGPRGLARDLWRQTWEEVTTLSRGRVYPSRWPVEEVVEISIGGWVLDPSEYWTSGSRRDSIVVRELVPGCWGSRGPIRLQYIAGYLSPTEVETWQPAVDVVPHAWIRPTAESLLRFEADVAGITGAQEPAWPSESGESVSDGTITWTSRLAAELPPDIVQVALLTAKQWYRGDGDLPLGVASETDATGSTRYREGPVGPFSSIAESVLEAYR